MQTTTHRHGIPTKAAVSKMLKAFDRRMKARANVLYTPEMPYITWDDDYTQSRMDAFIQWASDQGALFGQYRESGAESGRLWFCNSHFKLKQ